MNEKAQAIAALLAEMEAEIDTLRQQVKAARVEGLRRARNALARNGIDNRVIEAIMDAEIAAIEHGKE